MRNNNLPSLIEEMDSLFNSNPFSIFNSFNSLLADADTRMQELMNDPNTKTYKSPDGSTVICYNTHCVDNGNLFPTRAKKEYVLSDYPRTNVGNDIKGDYKIEVFLPGFSKDQVYMDYKNGYFNIIATRNKPWKDVLVKCEDGETYTVPEDNGDTRELKDWGKIVQHQTLETPYEYQRVICNSSQYDIANLTKTLENGVLTIIVPAKEETKPKMLTFND